jgi:hypothetical protein
MFMATIWLNLTEPRKPMHDCFSMAAFTAPYWLDTPEHNMVLLIEW